MRLGVSSGMATLPLSVKESTGWLSICFHCPLFVSFNNLFLVCTDGIERNLPSS